MCISAEKGLMMRTLIALAAATIITAPAAAQKLGVGGTTVNSNTVVEKCAASVGTVSLVEERKAGGIEAGLSPQLAALIALARSQQGGAQVDPIPLLKLLAAESGCFLVVDRGEGFAAIQRERQIAQAGQTTAGAPSATLQASDYVLVAQMVYQDSNAGGLGALGGGTFGGGGGFKQSRKEAQTLLTLNRVATGTQEAAVTGQARKKDVGIALGGLLGMGIGALGGGYESTDIGKVTAAALLDGYNKMVVKVRAKTANAVASLPVSQTGTTAVMPTSVAATPQR